MRGKISNPNLATVTDAIYFNGFLQDGVYGDLSQSSETEGNVTFNERYYMTSTTTIIYTVDLENETLASSVSRVYHGHANGEFTLSGAGLSSYEGVISGSGVVSGSETGFYVNGTWYVDSFTSEEVDYTSPAGPNYILRVTSTTYEMDANGGLSSTTSQIYSGTSGAFTIDASGVISGSESGCVYNGGLYVNGTTSETTNYTSPNGRHYTTREFTGTYSLSQEGNLLSVTTETYIGDNISFTIDPYGAISGSESGYRGNTGTWWINYTADRPGGAIMTLFGTDYTCTGGSESKSYDSNGNITTTTNDNYTSAEGGNFYVWSDSSNSTSGMTGWDPYVGSFQTDNVTGEVLFNAERIAPSFLPAQLWLSGALLSFQSGVVDANGFVTDSYSGSDSQGNPLTLTISSQMRGYFANGSSAALELNGTNVGAVTLNGEPEVNGYDLQTSDPNRTTPLFFAGTTLWVNGSEYPFTGGFEDSAGNRTDTYVSPGGGSLTFSGNTADATTATVQVSWDNSPYEGTASFSSGSASFEVGDLDISTLPPSSGPPALWAAGRFYTRLENTNRYTCTVGEATYQLSLNGVNAQNLTLTGSGSGGALTGSFDASHGGVFLLLQGGTTLVTACPANADGTLRQSAQSVPDNLPPAVMVTGAGIWRFLGTIQENGGAVACYLNASNADSTEASHGAGCLLKIDASGAVTLKNYLTGTTQIGSYGLSTHLFQTGTTASLPMPIIGVDPNANNTPWGLSTPENAPASFQVGQDLWRYAGAGSNGTTLYQGYHNGQQLSLGAAGAGGGRLVTVTDPVNGNTTGLLNDVRAGTRLANGTMVYAGGMDGTRAPATVNNNSLATLTGNLDIPGNTLTLGSLNGDAAASGLTLQFSDSTTPQGDNIALLRQELGRNAAQWSWWRASPVNGAGTVPVMALDSGWGLTLYDPANPSAAAISLNPANGTITLNGQPVLTQSTADERYLRVDQLGGSNSAILTQDQADERYHQKGQPLRVQPAGDIDMGEFNQGPQP